MKPIILGLVLAVMACKTNSMLQAAVLFPPLSVIATQLNVSAGQQLPKGIVYNGHPFFFYVVGAQERANGRYIVELQAR